MRRGPRRGRARERGGLWGDENLKLRGDGVDADRHVGIPTVMGAYGGVIDDTFAPRFDSAAGLLWLRFAHVGSRDDTLVNG